ncbi:glycosyltransferase [Marinilabilia rubra]|nr:glycosyltransferase [Marinilabilia rubra]
MIFQFRSGWLKLPEINTGHHFHGRVFISVIIPFRNEEENLLKLVKNLSEQRFSPHHMEIVLVDDHSTDNGFETAKQLQKSHQWLKIVSSKKQGKKAALRSGISSATGELIVTTDADCHFSRDWLQTIAETYLEKNPDMIVMPVGMESGKRWIDRFQQNDYLALQLATAGAMGNGNPIISSGANLAFKKKSFLETSKNIQGTQYLSGDDVFLLHTFKSQSFRIIYLKSAQAMAKTYPADSLKQFLLQRMRWGGKSKGYEDHFARNTALTILIVNTFIAIMPFIALFFGIQFFTIWVAAVLIKTSADWSLLNSGKSFFSVRTGLPAFLSFSLIYPYYILTAGVGSLFIRESWKDRKGR